jgi:hypothetical protein
VLKYTLKRSRFLEIGLTKRCEIRKVNHGPRPSITIGLRYSRYLKRPQRDSCTYSPTVKVIMSPTPRRSRSPEVAWWMACSKRHW